MHKTVFYREIEINRICRLFLKSNFSFLFFPKNNFKFLQNHGYDENGYDSNGYDGLGYDHLGYDKEGYNQEGYNKFNKKKNEVHSD